MPKRRPTTKTAEPTNAQRAGWAYTALEAFANETGQLTSGDFEHDMPSVIGDLLANLMHYCEQEKIDFSLCLARGQGHFRHEKAHPDGG